MISGGISAFLLARNAVYRQRYERMKVKKRVRQEVVDEIEEQIRREKQQ